MKLRTLAGVVAIAFALSAGVASAEPTCAIDGVKPSSQSNPQQLMQMPGYNVGTGAACVTDGSSPSYQRDQQKLMREPGYSIGTGSAQVNGH
jgi:hypothetical protein